MEVHTLDNSVQLLTIFWPPIKQGYPLNLSISISGGKETNRDCLSSGE